MLALVKVMVRVRVKVLVTILVAVFIQVEKTDLAHNLEHQKNLMNQT
jgi:hypothetical protein